MIDYRRRSEKLLRVEVQSTELTIFVNEGIDVNPIFEDLIALKLEPSARFYRTTSLNRIWSLCKMRYYAFGKALKLRDHFRYKRYLSPIKIYRADIETSLFDAIASRMPAESVMKISMNDLARISHAAFWATLPREKAEPLVRSWYN